ncbi:glycosyltransferase [Marinovum sp. 2_MG-2023]|uniref:glycosyltransferase n=1 Tax=Roseobacteraceae TaxID=2854170 RepID=UPI001FD4F65B|nr:MULTISPECIES: glycosyltransferase [Roseobacteraceae]MCJ7872823.1 glycosyltransferase family 2 protein [Phaeobacter sp. J2-8]MDO6730063.1 glycosyltransferase [Marinovum sp. 2_MG-2023]MDO6779877.1 glycosyltransferase [Marinovum sp. 1_MG-2023]
MILALSHLAYFSVVILLVTLVPKTALGEISYATNTIFIMGFLGTWRYSWAAVNFTRAIIFRRIVHPKRKRKNRKRFAALVGKSHMYMLVTSYMVEPHVTLPVYRSVFRAASRARDGATIVASVVDGADERLIRSIFESQTEDMSNVQLIIDRIKANGKRDALAKTLRILGAQSPTHRDILVFVDGDTMVPEDIWYESAPVFTDPKVGALTTDEGIRIDKENLFKDWFVLRFNQRQVMMCSMGLSKHVLTLTGRMSVFRADLATRPDFIEGINYDFLDHWRLGRVKFLTGDDKSTWFWLLKNGYEMHYLPDVASISYETQPRPTFFDSSKTLMVRWFGNMIRTNGRAMRLSPRLIGPFTWWSIIDQRVSMWTTLVGPITVALAALMVTPSVIPLYIAWVLTTRYIFCVIIALFRGTWFPITHPPILYFSQVVGAALKTYVSFRMDKQKWTRQGSGTVRKVVAFRDKLKASESTAHHAIAITWLTVAILFFTKV